MINAEAFRRTKRDWLVGGAGIAAKRRMPPFGANTALLRLCQSIRELRVAQMHCRRRIFCQVIALTRIAEPYEVLAKLQEKLFQGEWLVKDVGIGN